jgi:tRNA threonylcarbamoyladenosine biosynthesis protein TsaE
MPEERVVILSKSEKETFEIGKSLGTILKKEGRALVCLFGDLGAGKTVFVKGIAEALGLEEREIGSASFVIGREFKTKAQDGKELIFHHIDLYRIEDIEEEDWIWEYMGRGVTAIEWAEKLQEVPEGAIKVYIKIKEKDEREISIEGLDKIHRDNIQKRKA